MRLTIVEIVNENNIVSEDAQQYLRFLPVWEKFSVWQDDVVCIVGQKIAEVMGDRLPSGRKIVFSKERLSPVDGGEVAGNLEEALRLAEESERVVVLGNEGEIAGFDRADDLYLIKQHLERSEENGTEADLKSWWEIERDLYWDRQGNYSVIRYGKETERVEISVILSTYNQPEWLEKVLYGYACQSFKNFEVIVADDGSSEDTYRLIERLRLSLPFSLKHVWHEDQGFRKCVILNKAISASQADYLLFSDGDCVPRADFLSKHIQYRKPGYFLSGGYHKLSMNTSLAITKADIFEGHCFDLNWLKSHGMKSSFKNNKLNAHGFKEWLLNTFTPTKATWNGHNASGWRKDIVAVNGFDERMEYGGEDREMGERMMNAGIHTRQIRYSAITIHLDHKRGYVRQEALDKNRAIRKETAARKSVWTDYGILKSRL